jgi:putative FmdB family regulatory protein
VPVYEYICDRCGKRIERLCPVVDRDSIVNCTCGHNMTRHLSTFSYKTFNVFTTHGEGLQSVIMSKDEYKHRISEGSLGDYQDVMRNSIKTNIPQKVG